jgi:hypothetical protein
MICWRKCFTFMHSSCRAILPRIQHFHKSCVSHTLYTFWLKNLRVKHIWIIWWNREMCLPWNTVLLSPQLMLNSVKGVHTSHDTCSMKHSSLSEAHNQQTSPFSWKPEHFLQFRPISPKWSLPIRFWHNCKHFSPPCNICDPPTSVSLIHDPN